jgi:polyferredoxin
VLKKLKQRILIFLIVIVSGMIPAIIVQFFLEKPVGRNIHISSFRYGKDPSVIRINRGDTLHLTFSTEDTGHSFYLEEFNIDVKVSPARETVEVFEVQDPTKKSKTQREVVLVAKHQGIQNFLVSKSIYRCHVWCGPMHAFEQGKLILLPNTLLVFSLGGMAGILLLWFLGFSKKNKFTSFSNLKDDQSDYRDLLGNSRFLNKIVKSRWPQISLTFLAMALMYIVVLTTFFGTKMSGRNLGVLLLWGIWLFLLIAVIMPFLGRFWCTICPLPFFGDLIQRKSVDSPIHGKKKEYQNNYGGLFLKWPQWLRNDWPKLLILLALTTFSTTLVAVPKVTGYAVVFLVIVPTILSMVFEHRAFCRYLCPVSGFVGPFSRMSTLAIRNKSQKTCDKCKANFCEFGSKSGWACPYGINVGEMKESTDCGLCLECTRSCSYNNVTLYRRPFATELGTRNMSQAWLIIGIFTLAIVYCILYQGHWPVVRDYINILDKGNWNLFGIYAIIVWISTLAIMPGILYGLSYISKRISKVSENTKNIFLTSSATLLPLGLMLWISFVIPMLFVNVTFVMQSLSDPFGWGWDFFETANIPWHQFVPKLVPWLQAALILYGLYLSLRNLKRSWEMKTVEKDKQFLLSLPIALFLVAGTCLMLIFFTN